MAKKKSSASKILFTVHQQITHYPSGSDGKPFERKVRVGKEFTREFSEAAHGEDWKKLADEFAETNAEHILNREEVEEVLQENE